MSTPQVIACYSETGGATKTTTAVSLAAIAALAGHRVVLIDLDPRGAASKWLDVVPVDEGLHVGAILADRDPLGWASDMQASTAWSSNLTMIPADRAVSRREKDVDEGHEWRLKAALTGLDADLVVLDCPNRQGGPLIANALVASTHMLIATQPTEDGLDGVDGAMDTIKRFRTSQARRGAPTDLQIGGIVVGAFRDTITPRDETRALTELRSAHGALLLDPPIPWRVIVREARSAHAWYGSYPKGEVVAAAYTSIAHQTITSMKEPK